MPPDINIIVAHDRNRLIGDSTANQMPWRLPAELRRFRELTTRGSAVNALVMGRKTYDSIGRPLPGRRNIVITTQPDLEVEGCEVVHSLEEALKLAKENGEVFVIGGASIYLLAMPVADRLFITEVDGSFDGDIFFPTLDLAEWMEVSREIRPANAENPYNLTHIEYERSR